MNLKKTNHHFYLGLTLLGILMAALGSHSADSDWLLKPPGLRPLSEPAIVIPAAHQYVNQKLELPSYRSASGTPLEGWSKEFVKTRRFASDQSAWVYFRPSDLKQAQVIETAGIPDALRVWPVGATLILESYKGDASLAAEASLVEIEAMTKLAPGPKSANGNFFPVDWNYGRYTPDGTWSLSREKLIECHQCHSIAFQLTGDLVFTLFR